MIKIFRQVSAALPRLPEQSLVWLYLNKSTHEEANGEDLDVGVVELVVQTLESLNALQLRVR